MNGQNCVSIWDGVVGREVGDGNGSATTPAVKLTGKHKGIVVPGSGDGSMYGIDLASGEIKWKHTSGSAVFNISPYRRADWPLLSSPVIADSQVCFGSAEGFPSYLDLGAGQEWGAHEIGAPMMSTTIPSGKHLYVAAN